MDAPDKGMLQNTQLISVSRQDSVRILEVYVKRSMSLNDGTSTDPGPRRTKRRSRKWVTLPGEKEKVRRRSSDLGPQYVKEVPTPKVVDDVSDATLERSIEQEDTPKEGKKSKKKKKPSIWKSFLGLFSSNGSEKKDVEEPSPVVQPKTTDSKDVQCPNDASCPPLPGTQATLRKSKRHRFSKRRLSLRRDKNKGGAHGGSVKRPPSMVLPDATDISGVESVVSVEPTQAYYEKVSEELEKIVQERKETETPTTDEEVIKRIIELMKQEGDAINDKVRENASLSAFFQRVSYSSFSQLADTYMETEIPSQQTTTAGARHTTAPELVKLAFTLDFTARVAGLSRQATGHIMGLGNRYLQDRFTYTQVQTEQPSYNLDE